MYTPLVKLHILIHSISPVLALCRGILPVELRLRDHLYVPVFDKIIYTVFFLFQHLCIGFAVVTGLKAQTECQ